MTASAMGPPMVRKGLAPAERRESRPPDPRRLAEDVLRLLRNGRHKLATALAAELPGAIEAEVDRAVAFGWLQGFANAEKSRRRRLEEQEKAARGTKETSK